MSLSFFVSVSFKSGSCFVIQAGVKLMAILLLQPFENWGYKYVICVQLSEETLATSLGPFLLQLLLDQALLSDSGAAVWDPPEDSC